MPTIIIEGNELYHFGVKGQQWGKRQYQYEDGSLTPEGREHYGYGPAKAKMIDAKTRMQRAKVVAKDSQRSYVDHVRLLNVTNKNKNYENARKQRMQSDMKEYYDSKKVFKEAKKEYKNSEEYKQAKKDTAKKVAIAGAAIVGTALAAYGTYKIYENRENIKEDIKVGKDTVSAIFKGFDSSDYQGGWSGTYKNGLSDNMKIYQKGLLNLTTGNVKNEKGQVISTYHKYSLNGSKSVKEYDKYINDVLNRQDLLNEAVNLYKNKNIIKIN